MVARRNSMRAGEDEVWYALHSDLPSQLPVSFNLGVESLRCGGAAR